jgi:hypothetical protein
MPAHQRLRLDDNRAFAHRREQPIEPDEDQAICRAQPEPCWRGPLQDDKLLAEKCHFGLASRMRSEQSDEQSAEQLQEVKHPKTRITHCGICASPDTIFGSHSAQLLLPEGQGPRYPSQQHLQRPSASTSGSTIELDILSCRRSSPDISHMLGASGLWI